MVKIFITFLTVGRDHIANGSHREWTKLGLYNEHTHSSEDTHAVTLRHSECNRQKKVILPPS